MQSLGKVLMIMCLPIPLYIRLAIYYYHEAEEINNRHEAIDNLGVTMMAKYDLFYLLTPTHPFYQIVYTIITISLVSLIILQRIDQIEFEEIIVETFKDI